MKAIDNTHELVGLFRASNAARPILLLGAGASFSSGVPLAAESVRRLARRVFADKVKGGAIPPEHVKVTEWQSWLQAHDWFIKGEDRLAENFPLVVQHLLNPREYRAKTLLELLQPSNDIGSGYRRIAEIMMRGLVHTILTTNLDICLPTALSTLRPHIPRISEVNRGPDDLREFNVFNRAQIVWLHGRVEQYTDRNIFDEIEKLDSNLITSLVPLLSASPLIVVGYRGAEPSIMECLLSNNRVATQNYRNGIYWCIRKGEKLHQSAHDLGAAIGSNFKLIEIAGFDELMEELSSELHDEDLYRGTHTSRNAVGPLSFDDQPCPDVRFEELDQDLMLTVMSEYCRALGRAPVTTGTLHSLLEEQGLLVLSGSTHVPTVGCVLLFGRDPQVQFPHAVVSATVDGKKRLVFEGNLIRQRLDLLEWLGSSEVNPRLRVKRRTRHEEKTAYSDRALVELLVNMLVHRDYSVSDLATIEVESSVSISFNNPGGLVDSVARRVKIDENGCFLPVPNVSDLRNRSLCDVFFGMQAMEREGTGLSDVQAMTRDVGGRVTFVHNASNSGSFRAQIFQPAASVGSSTVARHDRPTGVYVLNVLPFGSMPDVLSTIHLKVRLAERPPAIALDGLGTFVEHDGILWSFASDSHILERLSPIVQANVTTTRLREEVERNEDERRVLSWLLRKHFENHLFNFRESGLILENERSSRRRAYFEGIDRKPRTFVYSTPRRKSVSREVVKQRAEGEKTWFENEGFGYDVVQIDGIWAVRIKPFYMFTGRDARTPLPAFLRTARATRRIKYDRNKSVGDDLTFWSRFLSNGAATINIGQELVPDLILEGSFMSIEVAEEGLEGAHNEAQHRVFAGT